VFGTAYLMRPLGGIVFGHIGDRFGRKKALLATLVCMGLGSMAMGFLPIHAQAGIWATVLLVVVRMVQGFSAGGEVGGSATFISESAPRHLEATYGAFTPLGSTMGFAMAAAVAGTVSAFTTDVQLESWGWRVPFLLALPLTLLCLWARTRVEETHGEDADSGPAQAPVVAVFRRQPLALLQSVGISVACNGTAYIGLTYMSIHLMKSLGYERTPGPRSARTRSCRCCSTRTSASPVSRWAGTSVSSSPVAPPRSSPSGSWRRPETSSPPPSS
jgi:MHS family proline/betaine transporter-like MFS transporter